MDFEHEEVVRDFISEWECERSWDSSQIERILDHRAPEARYHVFAWEEPFVGHDAIRDELLRQAPGFRDTREEIVNLASVGQTVFVERRDWVTMNDERAGFHVVGVFEVDADGKIAIWRDYLDSRAPPRLGRAAGKRAPKSRHICRTAPPDWELALC